MYSWVLVLVLFQYDFVSHHRMQLGKLCNCAIRYHPSTTVLSLLDVWCNWVKLSELLSRKETEFYTWCLELKKKLSYNVLKEWRFILISIVWWLKKSHQLKEKRYSVDILVTSWSWKCNDPALLSYNQEQMQSKAQTSVISNLSKSFGLNLHLGKSKIRKILSTNDRQMNWVRYGGKKHKGSRKQVFVKSVAYGKKLTCLACTQRMLRSISNHPRYNLPYQTYGICAVLFL